MLIIFFFILVALFLYVTFVNGSWRKNSKAPLYRPVDLESPTEKKFFFALEAYVGGRAKILSKVRLADLAQPVVSRRSVW